MTTPLPSARRLEGPGSAARTERLQRRFRQLHAPGRRSRLAAVGKPLLVAYWIACLTVITIGLDRLYPDVRPAVAEWAASTAPPP